MKSTLLFVIGIIAVLLCGCAETTQQIVPFPDQSKTVEDPAKARIYVMRPSGFGSALVSPVADAGIFMGYTGPHGYLCWERPAGQTVISCSSMVESRSAPGNAVTLTVQTGRVYYVFQHSRMASPIARTELEVVDEAKGEQVLKKCRAPIQRVKGIEAFAAAGNVEKVKAMLAANPEAVSQHDSGRTPLHWAALNGQRDVVVLLLESNANVNAQDSIGNTPLHLASYMGHKEIVEILLSRKPEVDADNSSGATPLHMAAVAGHADVVALLLTNKADVNARDIYHNTPLHLAAAGGHADVAAVLLANNADVDATRTDGTTPLMMAARDGSKDVVALLLANHADVFATDNEGHSALFLATAAKHPDVAALLSRPAPH